MLHSPPMPLTIFCDFDGTIVPYDSEFEIFARFGGPDKAGDVVARWERRELTARERIEQGFARLRVSRAALEDFLDEVPIDPTFPPFVRFCQDHSLPLTILSDGLVWYIQRILDRHGLGDLPIVANEIAFADPADVSTATLSFPFFNGDCNPCRQCGCCKRYVIREHKEPGKQVVLISDGHADRYAARERDLIFARDALLEYCRLHNLPAIPFRNFDDVHKTLLELFEPVNVLRPRSRPAHRLSG